MGSQRQTLKVTRSLHVSPATHISSVWMENVKHFLHCKVASLLPTHFLQIMDDIHLDLGVERARPNHQHHLPGSRNSTNLLPSVSRRSRGAVTSFANTHHRCGLRLYQYSTFKFPPSAFSYHDPCAFGPTASTVLVLFHALARRSLRERCLVHLGDEILPSAP